MQTKLILFEGNPFTGKSTLSEHVAQQLALNGHAVEWLHEGAMWQHFPQILELLDQAQPISDEVLWAEWTAFAQTVEAGEVRVSHEDLAPGSPARARRYRLSGAPPVPPARLASREWSSSNPSGRVGGGRWQDPAVSFERSS